MARTYISNKFPIKSKLLNDRGGQDLSKIDNAFFDSNIWETLANSQKSDNRKNKMAQNLVDNKDYNFARVKAREKKFMNDGAKVNMRLQRMYGECIKETQDDIMKLYEDIMEDMKLFNKGTKLNTLTDAQKKLLSEKISLNGAKLMGLDDNLKRMENRVDTLFKGYNQSVGTHLKNTYAQAYNGSFIDAKKGLFKNKYPINDVGKGFSALSMQDRLVEEAVRSSWGMHDLDFSETIWGQQDQLKIDLRDTITKGFIKGETVDEMSERIAQTTGKSLNRAKCLVSTETNRVFNQAQSKSLIDQGYETGIIQAIVDKRTSDECSTLNGTEVDLAKASPGINIPPFHPRCRSIVVPKIANQEIQQRWRGKSEDAHTYEWDSLPQDMQDDILKGKPLEKAIGFNAPNVKVPEEIFNALPKHQQNLIINNGLIDIPKPINYPKKSPIAKPIAPPITKPIAKPIAKPIDTPNVNTVPTTQIPTKKTIGKQADGTYYFGDEPLQYDEILNVDNHLGFNSVFQCEEHLKDALNINYISVDGISNEALVSATNKLDMLMNKYPNMKGRLVELIDDPHGTAYGWCQYVGTTYENGVKGTKSRISLSRAKFNSKNKYQLNLDRKEEAELGFKVKNSSWQETLVHEFGHALHNDLFASAPDMDYVLDKYRKQALQTITGADISDMDEDFIWREIMHEVSEYATTNPKETFAETFVDYIINGDDASDFTKEYFKLIEKDKQKYINSFKK